MSRRTILFSLGGLILIALAVGAWFVFAPPKDNSPSAATGLPPDQVTADDHVMGSPNAPVTLIEYFSQGCSACAHFDAAIFPQMKAQYIDTGKVRYVMRLFPLFA